MSEDVFGREEPEVPQAEIDAHFASLNGRAASTPTTDPGSFADRVASRRVDLVQRVRDGIPPVDYLAGSSEILRRGKRHHAVAPKKVGKSFGALILSVDMALAGETIVVFDRENGADLYAARLDQIRAARGLDEVAMRLLADQIRYFEFPRFREGDREQLAALCADASLVVFDSQRMFLSDLGLEESSNDDYAAFMAVLIDPLFVAGIATLILDNAGHDEPGRGRGASAKGDLNEILFAFSEAEPFDLETAGRLRLEIRDSRFGDSGSWDLLLGGGIFETWERVEDARPAEWQPTHYMEKVSRFIEENPGASKGDIEVILGGKASYVRQALAQLVLKKHVKRADGPHGAHVHTSLKPYRQADGDIVPSTRDEQGTSRDEQTLDHPQVVLVPRPFLRRDEDDEPTGSPPRTGTTDGRGRPIDCPIHGPTLVVKEAAGFVYSACGCRHADESEPTWDETEEAALDLQRETGQYGHPLADVIERARQNREKDDDIPLDLKEDE